jgi:succinoglycan biosynthesis protein ExoM
LTVAADIDVCICTYRRPSLALTLGSVAGQQLPAPLKIRVIVADNDVEPSGEALARSTAQSLGLALHYVHAPSRNISLARNACLDAVEAPLAAFLDDDEIAGPDWLANLLAAKAQTGADVVFGPVRADYAPDAPRWLRRADLHSFQAVTLADGSVRTGYTSNTLMSREAIGPARFDLSLGQSGGEDTEFFARLYGAGVKLAAAPRALVSEPVPPARARLGWLLERSFRSGQTHARLLVEGGASRGSAAVVAAAKFAACMAASLVNVWDPARAARQLVRGALHAGVVARLLGVQDLQIYAKPQPKA